MKISFTKEQYKEHIHEINSLLMEMACELAETQLSKVHGKDVEEFYEPVDENDDNGGDILKNEFQDEFNRYYDEHMNRLSFDIGFDISENDGVLKP